MDPENNGIQNPFLPEHQPSWWKPTKTIIMLIVASVAVVLGLGLGLFFVLNSNSGQLSDDHYSVVIDAGSSGSRVHVFKYSVDQSSGKPVIDLKKDHHKWEDKTNDIGLSKYAKDPFKAWLSVKKLVVYAKTIVPEEKRKTTEIRLMATAGMRLVADETARDQIMNFTRVALEESGFKFHPNWAEIITGSKEGYYAWVIANYALRSLEKVPSETMGILELGGASAQVTFLSSNDDLPDTDEDTHKRSYGNALDDKIYSHSFNEFGKDVALQKVMKKLQREAVAQGENVKAQDPCTPKEYTYGINSHKYLSVFLADESEFTKLTANGDFDSCKELTDQLLMDDNDKCTCKEIAASGFSKSRNATFAPRQEEKADCPTDYECAIGSTPTLKLEGNFLALAGFYFTAQVFGVEKKSDWLPKLRDEGKKFCEKRWPDLKVEYKAKLEKYYNEEYLRGYCFASAYIISMIEKLGLDEKRVKFSKGENNISLDWALGAFIDSVTPRAH